MGFAFDPQPIRKQASSKRNGDAQLVRVKLAKCFRLLVIFKESGPLGRFFL